MLCRVFIFMQADKNTAIIIAGPTAVGKTSVAIDVAKHFNTEIISADSRQCYKELAIGVARPSIEELGAVPHHFVATHSIHEKITAADFEQYALQKTEEIFAKNSVVVITGGTGLYLNAFTNGLDEIPPVPNEMRSIILLQYQQHGIDWLQQQIKEKDPRFFNHGEIKNPHRLMRALEVVEATGKSILDFRTSRKTERSFDIIKVALNLPREQLYTNINTRVDKMMEDGLLEEVKSVTSFQHFNALQTVGYKELFSYLKGEISIEQCIALIKQNTRRYAKRQLTWFKKDEEYKWFHPTEAFEYLTANVSS